MGHPPSEIQDKFRLLFEHSSDAHFIMIGDGLADRISDCNEAAVKMLKGKSKKEILSYHPAKFSPLYQPDGTLSAEKTIQMDALAKKNGFHRFEWMHQNLEGEVFPVEVTLNALEIEGRPALIAVWHDLTELKQKEDSLRRANEKMKNDLLAAAAIQRSLLPVSSPFVKRLRLSWLFEPCDELGGDMLNIFQLDDNHLGLYVLDVTGHGIAASLLSVAASHFLSPHSEVSFVRKSNLQSPYSFERPSEVVSKLNRHFSSNPDNLQLFTLLYGVLDIDTCEFAYSCAGHPFPIVLSADGTAKIVEGGDIPIGIARDYEYKEMKIQLNQGERLYLYSDGIVETRNLNQEQFGQERFLKGLGQVSSEPIAKSLEFIAGQNAAWAQPEKPQDDMTLLVCEVCCQKNCDMKG